MISVEQVRAARAMLGLKQQELAEYFHCRAEQYRARGANNVWDKESVAQVINHAC